MKAAIERLKEAVKVPRYIGDSSWPKGMEKIRTNLLQSMKLYKEVNWNQGNAIAVIDSLRSALQLVDPELLDKCDIGLRDWKDSSEHVTESTEGKSAEIEQRTQVGNIEVPERPPVPMKRTEDKIKQQELERDIGILNSKGILFYKKHGRTIASQTEKMTLHKCILLLPNHQHAQFGAFSI